MPTRTCNVISHSCCTSQKFSEPSRIEPSKKDERILALAAEQALKSKEIKKHGAVFVIGGKIVSQGYNKKAALKRDMSRMTTIHAESAAITEYIRRMARAETYSRSGTLYIVRVGFDGYRSSKPCIVCNSFLEKVPFVKTIIYSDDGNIFFKMNKIL